MTPLDSLLQDTFRFIVWMTPIDSFFTLTWLAGLSIFCKSTSTSLFTGSTFYYNFNDFHEYLTQHSLKSGDIKDHIRQVKVPSPTPYWKAWNWMMPDGWGSGEIKTYIVGHTSSALPPSFSGINIVGHSSSKLPPSFSGINIVQYLVFCVVFCTSLFVLLSFFCWP